MQRLDFETFLHFFATHAKLILPALIVLLGLIFAFNHWRERRLMQKMENLLFANHQDVLLKQDKLNKSPQKNLDSVSPAINKSHVKSVLDAELEVIKREMDARLQARKKN